MDIQTLIDKWKINQALLAKKLGMSTGGFSLKLRKKYDQYFKEDQQSIIDQSLEEMYNDIGEYLGKNKK